jgi:hypothetical protein
MCRFSAKSWGDPAFGRHQIKKSEESFGAAEFPPLRDNELQTVTLGNSTGWE